MNPPTKDGYVFTSRDLDELYLASYDYETSTWKVLVVQHVMLLSHYDEPPFNPIK